MMLDLPYAGRRTIALVLAMGLMAVSALSACGGDSDDDSADGADVVTPTAAPTAASGLMLTSDAFADDATIPTQYTCSGDNDSPPLRWNGAPAETGAFVLLVDDPDAPGGTFDHWVVYDLPASTTELPAGVPAGETLAGGGTQGENGVGQTAYMGPCPPPGPEHHYNFRLFALDAPLNLDPGKSKAEVEQAMETHILAQTELTGLFGR